MTRRNPSDDIKTRQERQPGINAEGSYLPTAWCPAFRWQDLQTGSDMEHGNLRLRCKSKSASGTHVSMKVEMRNQGAELLVVVTKAVKAAGAKGQCYSVGYSCQPKGRSRNK